MACPVCKCKTQWPGAYCPTHGLEKLRQLHGETVRFTVKNHDGNVKLALRPGELARHHAIKTVDDVPFRFYRQWINDGQGIEYTWSVRIGSQEPIKGQMYLPYEQVSALEDPVLAEPLEIMA